MPEPDRLTWLGHATMLAELDGARILTDPLLRRRPMHLRRHVPDPDPEALRRLDAVFISHLHLDHLDVPSLRRLGTDVRLIVPRGAGGVVRRAGFATVEEVAEGDTVQVGAVAVTAVRADHDRHRLPGGPVAPPLGYVLDGSRRIYFAGDTSLYEEMRQLGHPRLDVALLPIWGWGPRLGPGHMDPHEASRAVALLEPVTAIPIHWGTYFPHGLGGRRHMAFVDAPRIFAQAVADLAPGTEVRVLEPGGALDLQPAVSRAPRR
jgi:L-ascorbate metabolism protein UlaG (beta-lactamase superfamily)